MFVKKIKVIHIVLRKRYKMFASNKTEKKEFCGIKLNRKHVYNTEAQQLSLKYISKYPLQ